MRYVLIFGLCLSHLIFGNQHILKEFPTSPVSISQFTQSKLSSFDEQFPLFIKNLPKMNTFTELTTQWNEIIYPLFQMGVVLQFLPLITTEQEAIKAAITHGVLIEEKAKLAMKTSKVSSAMLDFAQNPAKQKSLTPYERYSLLQILQSLPESKEIDLAKQTLSSFPLQPFLYAKGDKAEKALSKDRTLTCLTWNVCLFDTNLSMLFGGVLPWQSRIHQIAEKIVKLQPDIVCLQEVFSANANLVLVEKLRAHYAHFYYKIGPHPFGFSLESLGLPSGLFVASKYPLQAEQFTPYGVEETPSYRSYGFFSADIYSKNERIGHFVTTHLQPGYEESDKAFRQKQLLAIAKRLPQNTPIFLCGDLNIASGSEEAKSAFTAYEPVSYQGLDWTCCELRDYWWRAQQNSQEFIALNPQKEWLDYFFLIAKKGQLSCKTQVLCVNDLGNPEEALSDHQILFSTFDFRTK